MRIAANTKRIGILVVPRFPLLGFSAAIVPFREVNRHVGKVLYETMSLSVGGAPVVAEGGVAVVTDCALRDAPDLDAIFVCAGFDPQHHVGARILSWIRSRERAGAEIGAISTGTHILARAGVLHGHRCTIHWENAAGFAEEFPEIDLRNSLFEIDRNRLTCAGGTSAMDMMLNVIARDHGADLALAVSHQFQHERIRTHADLQGSVEFFFQQTGSWKVATACRFLKVQGAASISPRDLADHVGVSQRQLQRLFRKYLNCTPKRHVTELRLQYARELLLSTDLRVAEVVAASGFDSRSNFHAAYRGFFGRSPGDERRKVTRFEA
jgi:AraC family transcriptional regulator, glycine betaine-responsive activator